MKKICDFYCLETQIPPTVQPQLKAQMESLIRHKKVRCFRVDYLPNDFFLCVLRSLKELKEKYRFLSILLTVSPADLNRFSATGLLPDFLPYLHVEGKYHTNYPYWADWEPNYIIVYDPDDYQDVQGLLLPPSFPYSTPINLAKRRPSQTPIPIPKKQP